jgi:hypothetical protein
MPGLKPPVPSASPWVDASRIAAATSPDVKAAIENGRDDRSFVQRSADGSKARACAQPAKWKYTYGAKPPKAKRRRVERTPEVRAYFREWARKQRAREKASTNA